ncbi:MAG: porin [Deltaproteobacteria bacterium]|nr:porin [Deltaproteobacteria bacterium]
MKIYAEKRHSMPYYLSSISRICFPALLALFYLNTTAIAKDVDREIELLRQKLEQQNQRIEELEKEQSGIKSDNSIRSFLTVGGRVQFDALYNRPSVGGPGGGNSGDLSVWPGAVPLDSSGERGQFNFHGRDSRIWLKSRIPTIEGYLASLIEVDFWGSSGNEKISNSHNIRLRHAYLEIGQLTMGQTNSTFHGTGNPDTFVLPATDVFARQPQIRFTQAFQSGDFRIALEQAETTLTNTSGIQLTPDDDRYPDIASRLTLRGDWGEASLSGLFREIRSDGALVAGVEDHVWGYGLYASGRLNTFGVDNLRLGIAYGDAIGRYVAGNTYNDGAIDSQGQIKLQTIVNAHISYQHWWSDNIRSNLAYAYVHADNDLNIVPATVDKEAYSLHMNIIFTTVDNVLYGMEYVHAERELENGQDGELDRVQFRMRYDF